MKVLSRLRQFSPSLGHYLFLGVFLLRLLSLERLSRSPLFLPARGDMHFYNEWALRIVRGEFDLHAAFYGLPLYPYFLAFVYRIFGYSPFLPGVFQAIVDGGTAVIIYLLSLRLLESAAAHPSQTPPSDRVYRTSAKTFAVVAALGWTFFVPAQAYSIVLMPTAWLVFVFWLVVWRLSFGTFEPGWKECLGLGFLIGFTAMAIATVLFLLPLVLAAIIVKRTGPPRLIWIQSAVLFLGVGIGTAPCWIHNYVIVRDPVFLSAHSGVNFWIGNNPAANGYPRFPPGLRAGQAAMLEDSITSAEAAAGRRLKRAEVSAYWSAKANNYIADHTGEWLKLIVVKARNFWNAFQYDDLSIITNLREQGVIFPGLYFGLVAALALPGMVWAWILAPTSRWLTAAIALHMIAVLTVFITERYRLPVVPGLLIMAAFGLWTLWRKLLGNRYVHAVAYLAMVILCAAFVSWPQRDPALWALDAYNSGWQALESGNLSLAEEKLTLARRYVPTNPETNFAFGNLRLAQGDKPAAASFYLHALQFEENHRGALNNLAVIALDQKRYDLAENWLRKVEQIDPLNAKTHFLLASALLGQGRSDAAAAEIETALRLRPQQIEFSRLKEKIAASRR